jgi:hypothetical protein
MFNRNLYYIFENSLKNNYWDWNVCSQVKYFVVSKPSVVQHISTTSVAGHDFAVMDRAYDF